MQGLIEGRDLVPGKGAHQQGSCWGSSRSMILVFPASADSRVRSQPKFEAIDRVRSTSLQAARPALG